MLCYKQFTVVFVIDLHVFMYYVFHLNIYVFIFTWLSRTSPEFQKLLGIAMEMFLLCSDDSESDVRMVADECLNKIIKVSRTQCSCLPRTFKNNESFNFLNQTIIWVVQF